MSACVMRREEITINPQAGCSMPMSRTDLHEIRKKWQEYIGICCAPRIYQNQNGVQRRLILLNKAESENEKPVCHDFLTTNHENNEIIWKYSQKFSQFVDEINMYENRNIYAK